jgi:ribosomal 50S subunit-recycling heat shock protein
MAEKHKFKPGDGPFRFKVKLEGQEGMDVAAFHPPFSVPEIFGTKARIPVRGAINGFPFRSSLANMGDGHMMVVNKSLRAGAKCKAGDLVDIVLQRDREERVVEVPEYLSKLIAADKAAKATWDSLSFTHKKEWVRSIEEAKKPETRQARIDKMLSAMRAGKRIGT